MAEACCCLRYATYGCTDADARRIYTSFATAHLIVTPEYLTTLYHQRHVRLPTRRTLLAARGTMLFAAARGSC